MASAGVERRSRAVFGVKWREMAFFGVVGRQSAFSMYLIFKAFSQTETRSSAECTPYAGALGAPAERHLRSDHRYLPLSRWPRAARLINESARQDGPRRRGRPGAVAGSRLTMTKTSRKHPILQLMAAKSQGRRPARERPAPRREDQVGAVGRAPLKLERGPPFR